MGEALAGARRTQNQTSRLFRHDRLIARNELRAAFAGWHDRSIAALMLLASLTVVRAWLADRPWTVAAWAALIAGTVLGIWAERLIATRLAFHAFEGLLASDALQPQMRRRYMAAWHGVGLALLAVVTLIVRPSLLMVSAPAYLGGVLVAGLTSGFRMRSRVAETTWPKWAIRAWAQRPVAGVSAAMFLLLSVLPARALDANALLTITGIETVLLALMLTSVDDEVVRFMDIAGHRARRIIARHASGVAAFLAMAVPECWILLGAVAAGIVATAGVAVMLLLILRILAYRLHARRFADLLVSILAGLLMLVAYSMPVALPVIALAMLWQLERRGRTKTWLLA